MTPEDHRGLRAATAELRDLLDGSVTATPSIELLVYLALWVSPLLDELERLQAERQDGGRPRIVKFDSAGGRA